ncbi:fluoride efflux transporter CrcB [Pseudonocardia hispaniensis]|uniref:Fluoride-specific ion channel FluC n=1 Tax=Pseudonocardia hispaniensis TaxID=904933 RepID=A0ABW1J4Q5_9PSEU
MDQTLPSSGENQVAEPRPHPVAPLSGQARACAVIAVGGALGALARWGVGLALPAHPGAFPLGTFLINVVGCLLIGVLIVLVTEVRPAHPLVRLFAATGILGGFTTFSTYSTDAQYLLLSGHVGAAVGYLAATLAGAIAATWLGITVTRAAGVRRVSR